MKIDKRKLGRSIITWVTVFFVFHSLMFTLVFFLFGLSDSACVFYVAISPPFFILLTLIFMWMRPSFYYVKNNSPMPGFGLADLFTLFRITSVPIILTLIANFVHRPAILPFLLAYIALAFISDFFDGRISRSRDEVSKIGQYMDSSSDYVILFMVGIAFGIYGIVDLWFLVVVLIRFSTQWILASLLYFKQVRDEALQATKLGKIAVFLTMIAFALALAKILPFLGSYASVVNVVMLGIEIAVSLVLLASLIEKFAIFARRIKRGPLDEAR